MQKSIRIFIWGLVVLAVLALGFMVIHWYSTELQIQQTQSGQGSVDIGGDFTLTDHTGKQVTAANFDDKPMVIYFGYTFCPDVCPTTLSEMTMWVDELGSDADKLNYLFITVDPERDDQESMARYVDAFFDQLVGLRGTPEQTKAVIKSYRVYAKKVEEDTADSNYVMDHTASVFLMKKGNVFSGTIAYGEDHDVAVDKLRKLIASAQ